MGSAILFKPLRPFNVGCCILKKATLWSLGTTTITITVTAFSKALVRRYFLGRSDTIHPHTKQAAAALPPTKAKNQVPPRGEERFVLQTSCCNDEPYEESGNLFASCLTKYCVRSLDLSHPSNHREIVSNYSITNCYNPFSRLKIQTNSPFSDNILFRNLTAPSVAEIFPGGKHQSTRLMSSSQENQETILRKKYRPRDTRFKTPYGHIACLEWGHPESPNKILCAHGWLDNAGSFERLIPFILDHKDNNEKYHIVAMDSPGVGLSSHKPPGSDYTTFSNIMEMRRVAQQLNWQKMTLLSHSLGSHLSFLYSCIYPTQVESMISIDLAHPLTRLVNNWNVTIANSIDDHFKCEYHHEDDPTTNIRVPVYSEVDAIKRLMDGHSSSLSRESAEVLLKRGAKKQRWGYTFNRDVRLRYLSLEMRPDDDLMLQFLQGPFRPNLFIIRANKSPYHRPEEVRLKYYELFKRNCPIFRDVILEGTHHLHMNTPQPVAAEINEFLDTVRASSQAKLDAALQMSVSSSSSTASSDGTLAINKSNL